MKSCIKYLAFALGVVGAVAGAQAQLTDVGSFGQKTYSTASNGYKPGRLMTWNGGDTFQAYCIDPYTGALLPGSYVTMSLDAFFGSGDSSSAYASQISRSGYSSQGLSTSQASQFKVRDDLKELFSWAYVDPSTSTARAAAFGLVAWEIVLQNWGSNGDSYSRTAGTFTTKGGDWTSGNFGSTELASTDKVEYWVDQYMKALNGTVTWASVLGSGATQTNWTYTVYFDDSPNSQTFVTAKQAPGGDQNVPEPVSAGLVGLALLGLRAARRKAAA